MAAKYDQRDYAMYTPKDYDKLPKKEKPITTGAILGKLLQYTQLQGDKLPRTLWAPFLQLVDVELEARDTSGGGIVGPKVVNTLQEAVIAHDTPLLSSMIDSLHLFQQLFVIEIVNCELQEMPQCLFEVEMLRVLRLSYNYITILRDDLGRSGNPSHLHTIQLDANRIQTIMPNTFFGKLFQLERLNLAQNRIMLLPEDFCAGCKKLRLLDLSDNFLTHLPATVCDTCTSLEILILNGNSLHALPKSLYNLRRLRKLFVSSNKLGELPDRIGECAQLEKIRAAKNSIRELPDSFINLWTQRGGRLDELLLEGNPLVKPSITALENHGLEHAMKLFVDMLNSSRSDEAESARAHYVRTQTMQADREKLLAAQREEELRDKDLQSVLSSVHSGSLLRQLSQGRLSGTADVTSPKSPVSPFSPAAAAASPALAGGRRKRREESKGAADRQEEAPPALPQKYEWYFSGCEEKVVQQIRNAESTLLMMKKQFYVQGRVQRATEAQKNMRESSGMLEPTLPQHLQKFLDPSFDARKYSGKVRITQWDVNFALLVFATKPLAPSCQSLFRQFDGGQGYLTLEQWQDFSNKAPVKLTEEMKDYIWRLCSTSGHQQTGVQFGGIDASQTSTGVMLETDFVAAWHIHDVESKCSWISRVAKVLKLEYYAMTLDELRRKVELSGAPRFQPHAIGNDDSSDEERFTKEQEVSIATVIPPKLEGERRLERAADDLNAVAVKREVPLQGAMVSMSQQEYVLFGGTYSDSSSDSGAEAGGDGLQALIEDDDLSLSDSSWHSEEAKEWIGDNDAADAAEGVAAQKQAPVAFPESAQDLQQLMMLPFAGLGLLRRTPASASAAAEEAAAPPKKAKAVRKRRAKKSSKDPRFKTDIFGVRINLREARRNLPEADFHILINFLLRGMKLMQHYTQKPTYWHTSDPSFRHATGIQEITVHTKNLLIEMGFVCVLDQYWCWPYKHLRHPSTANVWGNKLVPPQCPGLLPDRLDDMVKLFRMVQRELVHHQPTHSSV